MHNCIFKMTSNSILIVLTTSFKLKHSTAISPEIPNISCQGKTPHFKIVRCHAKKKKFVCIIYFSLNFRFSIMKKMNHCIGRRKIINVKINIINYRYKNTGSNWIYKFSGNPNTFCDLIAKMTIAI